MLRQIFIGGNLVKYLTDGERLLSIGREGIKTWDSMDGRPLQSFRGPLSWMESVAVSHDGSQVLFGSKRDDKPLELWDIASGKLVRRFLGFSAVSSVAFAPDDRIFSAGLGAAAKFWETDSGRSIRAFTPFRSWGIESLTFSRDGKKVLFGGSMWASVSVPDDSNLKLIDASSGRTLQKFSTQVPVNSVAMSPDDKRALSGSWGGTVSLWDISSGRPLYTFVGSQGAINTVEFSPDGKRVLSGGADGAVRIWNADNGKLVVSMFELGDGDWLTITPEGFFVASEHGAELLSVVQGLQVFGIDQVYQSLYRPDLVRGQLAGDPRGLVLQAASKLNLEGDCKRGSASRQDQFAARSERASSTQLSAES